MLWLKLIHTLIALINAAAVFYILFCGVTGRRGRGLCVSLLALGGEILALVIGGGTCPLQLQARRLLGVDEPVDDIFLPDWLAANLIEIFTPLALVGLALVARNEWRRRRGGA